MATISQQRALERLQQWFANLADDEMLDAYHPALQEHRAAMAGAESKELAWTGITSWATSSSASTERRCRTRVNCPKCQRPLPLQGEVIDADDLCDPEL